MQTHIRAIIYVIVLYFDIPQLKMLKCQETFSVRNEAYFEIIIYELQILLVRGNVRKVLFFIVNVRNINNRRKYSNISFTCFE